MENLYDKSLFFLSLLFLFGSYESESANKKQIEQAIKILKAREKAERLQKKKNTSHLVTEGDGGICGRTKQVIQEILRRSKRTDCSEVSSKQLKRIDKLYLTNRGITFLKAGDFSGLSSLRELWLDVNKLDSLTPGVFDKLSSLKQLGLDHGLLSNEAKAALRNKGIQIVE